MNLGYYYITQDTICKIASQDNHISDSENSKAIPDGSTIVCQEDALHGSFSGNMHKCYQSIEVNGNQRLYKPYNCSVESDYYESITWQSNKWIIEYQSGGAEKGPINLKIE